MAQSPLLGGDRAAQTAAGRSTDVLGPSDTSDSGSDVVGAVGAVDTDEIGLDSGTNDDIRRTPGAGADLGDANLDADSDAGGTGERAEAGRDTLMRDAPDLMPDQIVHIDTEGGGLDAEDDFGESDELAAAQDDDNDDEDLIDADAAASDSDSDSDSDSASDSDSDDGLTAQPPQRSAVPRRQRNTDRPVANGEDRRGDGRK